jgi:hypothetical protein
MRTGRMVARRADWRLQTPMIVRTPKPHSCAILPTPPNASLHPSRRASTRADSTATSYHYAYQGYPIAMFTY